MSFDAILIRVRQTWLNIVNKYSWIIIGWLSHSKRCFIPFLSKTGKWDIVLFCFLTFLVIVVVVAIHNTHKHDAVSFHNDSTSSWWYVVSFIQRLYIKNKIQWRLQQNFYSMLSQHQLFISFMLFVVRFFIFALCFGFLQTDSVYWPRRH